jgi:hypothetical protein
MSREAMQQALEALEILTDGYDGTEVGVEIEAITALRERLAQPEQEPVAWADKVGAVIPHSHKLFQSDLLKDYTRPLYTAPPKQWVGLTDEEVQMFIDARWSDGVNFTHFIRAIEAKLKEKNT